MFIIAIILLIHDNILVDQILLIIIATNQIHFVSLLNLALMLYVITIQSTALKLSNVLSLVNSIRLLKVGIIQVEIAEILLLAKSLAYFKFHFILMIILMLFVL